MKYLIPLSLIVAGAIAYFAYVHSPVLGAGTTATASTTALDTAISSSSNPVLCVWNTANKSYDTLQTPTFDASGSSYVIGPSALTATSTGETIDQYVSTTFTNLAPNIVVKSGSCN